MTVSGYLLLIRSCIDSMEQSVCNSESRIDTGIDSFLTELNVNEMASHCPAGSCHSKAVFYAAGILAGGVAIGYLVGQVLPFRKVRCNHIVKLDSKKVVDTVDVEDIGDKQVYCRCWNSKQFPLCDGSHVAHNERTGDNVGPLIVKNGNAPKTSKS